MVDIFLSKNIFRAELMSNGDFEVSPISLTPSATVGIKEILRDDLGLDLINTYVKIGEDDVTNEIAFFYYRRGVVFAGENKGLAYIVEDNNVKTVSQLNKIDRNDKEIYGKRLYKYLEPNWYIFYEYNP